MPTAHEGRDVMSTEPVTATRLTPFKDLVDTEIHLDHEHHRADPPPDFGALY